MAAMFWWEDGYDPLNPPKQQKAAKNKIKFDGDGQAFLLSMLETTGVHRLSVSFLPINSGTLITLNNTGRRFFSLAHYNIGLTPPATPEPLDINSNCSSSTATAVDDSIGSGGNTESQSKLPQQRALITESHSFAAVTNTGYFALSRDGNIMATGILKCDKMKIIDVRNDDLLVNVDGDFKMGYWGQLKFLGPPSSHGQQGQLTNDFNSSLLELRVLKMDRSNPTETILRMWDLGFRNPVDVPPEDEVDDDEENVLWSVKFTAGIVVYAAASNFIIVTHTKSEKLSFIQWIDRNTGTKTQELKVPDWCSKPVLSKDETVCAFGHIGKCIVRDAVSGAIISEITIPGMIVPFPIIPLGFVYHNRYVAMRVDLDMMLILSEWQPSPTKTLNKIVLNKVGGTISTDSVALSHDERYLACWPYGCIELFDLAAMTRKLTLKISCLHRVAILLPVLLTRLGRAAVANTSASTAFGKVCLSLAHIDDRIFRVVVGFL